MKTHTSSRATALVVVGLALATLTACGGGESGVDTTVALGADATDSTSVAVPTPPSAPVEPSTTATTRATTAATTTPDEDVANSCLSGDWLLDVDATLALYSALLPGMPLVVDGTQTLTFEGGAAEQYINALLRFQVPNMLIEFPYDVHDSGTYTVAGGTVSMTWTTAEGGVGTAFEQWIDTNGNDAGTYQMYAPLLADVELPRYAGGPITCENNTLTLGYTSGLANATAIYTRV